MTLSLLPVPELRELAAQVAAALLPVETAVMLPLPRKGDGGLEALIVYYQETGPRTNRTVHPPSHAMRLDAATGKLLHFGPTTPERLGIQRPLVPVPGARIDPAMTGMEFADKRARLLEISREVWLAFASGSAQVDATTADLVREYVDLFLQITKPEVAPFYLGAAKDFFAFLRAIAGAP